MQSRPELMRLCREAKNAGRLPKEFKCTQTSERLLSALEMLRARPMSPPTGVLPSIGGLPVEVFIHHVAVRLPISTLKRLASLNKELFYYLERGTNFWSLLIDKRIPIHHTEKIIRQMPGNGWRRYCRMFLPGRFKEITEYLLDSKTNRMVFVETRRLQPRLQGVYSSGVDHMDTLTVNNILRTSRFDLPILSDVYQPFSTQETHPSLGIIDVHHYIDLEGRLHLQLTGPPLDTPERFVDVFSTSSDTMYGEMFALVTTEGAVILTDNRKSYWYRVETDQPVLKVLFFNHPRLDDLYMFHTIDVFGGFHTYFLLFSNNNKTFRIVSHEPHTFESPVVKMVGDESGLYLLLEDGHLARVQFIYDRRREKDTRGTNVLPILDVHDISYNISATTLVFTDGRCGYIQFGGKLYILPKLKADNMLIVKTVKRITKPNGEIYDKRIAHYLYLKE